MIKDNFSEYFKIFLLDNSFLKNKKILDVASGISCFCAEGRKMGFDITAVDPYYSLSYEEMYLFANKELVEFLSRFCQQDFYFMLQDMYENYDDLRASKISELNIFLTDYRDKKNYISGRLPYLPFEKDTFDCTFCSNFLFLCNGVYNIDFHINSLLELIRVTKPGGSIMIYPLIDCDHRIYQSFNELIEKIKPHIFDYELVNSGFNFIPNACKFLSIIK